MIERLRRYWLELVAAYHREHALEHERLRGRALRKLEAIERRRRDRETQREIGDILARRGPPLGGIEAAELERRLDTPPRLVQVASGRPHYLRPETAIRRFNVVKDDCQ